MKMISPDGTGFIDAHPTKVEYLLSKGWKHGEAAENKSSPKKQAKAEVKENGNP
jgi:hypothetical protein|tara:strand:+ start:1297 stop:1458 length:162 start_codon:yes stop_codon:yes gene_type:complete